MTVPLPPGTRIELDVGAVAHGGHCVARHQGRVVFVRHTLPGERVLAAVTEDHGGSFLRADAVQVLVASHGRVSPPCPHAGPGRCGGCDWQHADPATQRELKQHALADVMHRIGGLDIGEVPVREVPGGPLGWRSRAQFVTDPAGTPGLRRHRSRSVVPLTQCPLVTPPIWELVAGRAWSPGLVIAAAASGTGEVVLDDHRDTGTRRRPRRSAGAGLHERAGGRGFAVDSGGFWQVHPAAADTLSAAVLELLDPRSGDRAADLFAGVGLFAAALASRVAAVTAVEVDARACADCRVNLADLPVDVRRAAVTPALVSDLDVELVVADPPRTGLGGELVAAILALAPRRFCYVSCEPSSLARDLRTAAADGYRLAELRAYDLFPMTHHLECVALLVAANSVS